jgi:hypothetical protein
MMSRLYLIAALLIVADGCSDIAEPNLAVLQSAYDRESTQANSRHDPNLQLTNAKCDDGTSGRFLCQVAFLSRSDPSERLYFDVVAIARQNDAWVLQSGLCKRR